MRGRKQDELVPDYYRDTGCHVHPACLSCPLPQCIHDLGQTRFTESRRERQREIAAYRTAHPELALDQIGSLFGVTTRTVNRATRAAS